MTTSHKEYSIGSSYVKNKLQQHVIPLLVQTNNKVSIETRENNINDPNEPYKVICQVPDMFLKLFKYFEPFINNQLFLDTRNIDGKNLSMKPPLSIELCSFLPKMVCYIFEAKFPDNVSEYVKFFDIADCLILDQNIVDTYVTQFFVNIKNKFVSITCCEEDKKNNSSYLWMYTFEFLHANIRCDLSRYPILKNVTDTCEKLIHRDIINNGFSNMSRCFILMQKSRAFLRKIINSIFDISQEILLIKLLSRLQELFIESNNLLKENVMYDLLGILNWKIISVVCIKQTIDIINQLTPKFKVPKHITLELDRRKQLYKSQKFFCYELSKMGNLGLPTENQYIQQITLSDKLIIRTTNNIFLYTTDSYCSLIQLSITLKKDNVNSSKVILVIKKMCPILDIQKLHTTVSINYFHNDYQDGSTKCTDIAPYSTTILQCNQEKILTASTDIDSTCSSSSTIVNSTDNVPITDINKWHWNNNEPFYRCYQTLPSKKINVNITFHSIYFV